MQRVTSTVERTAGGTVITGFEYTYDDLSRIVEEKVLANSTKMCYTYDSLGRVTKRTTKNLSDVTLYEENYSYDAAGNIIGDTANVGFTYDTNNRLVMFNGRSISYDLDGNMTSDYCTAYSYDSANRLLHVDGHMYTYNAEDVRICNHSAAYHTTYTYDTNRKLSRLLEKTTNNVVTKYVYGHGLICEETSSVVKTYHFDNRGSTVAITDASGAITDTITYDTYGMQTSHIGTSDVIFAYNGRDGVITDDNDLIYMRARYYSPVMRRFINADIIHGQISDSTSLNRYAYVNGNPVSLVDPFGLLGVITLMLIGAGVGAVINLASSFISQKIESDINNEEFELDVEQLVSDTVWGAVDGAISFSPLGPAGKFVGSTLVSIGSSATDELIDDEEGFDYLRAGESVALDLALGVFVFDFTNNANMGKALNETNEKIAKLNLRNNEKWAAKQIARQKVAFKDLLQFKIYEEFANGFLDIPKDVVKDRLIVRAK